MAAADDNDLGRQVEIIQSSADAAAVDAAIRALEPRIRETARQVCCYRRVSAQLSRDFIDDALAATLAPKPLAGTADARIASYQSSGGPFLGWLWRTLDNLLVDATRKAARRSKHELASAASKGAEPIHLDAELGLSQAGTNEPFGEPDLKRIESWRLRDRLRLLGSSELWRKVPPPVWESWCNGADVALPFPPSPNNFEQWNDWLALLADAMQESRAAFRQHWYRKRAQLAELDFVRGLRDEA
jgi:DNA-directed RNA polymerase specialized sigma24 family protein